jgi:hypothetical protein
MIRQIYRYLYPHRKLHRVPKEVSAVYERVQMTPEEEIIIMAGLARDPAGARDTFKRLHRLHGDEVFRHVRLELRRKRHKTAGERAWMLIRQILGENEPRKLERRRKVDPMIKTAYRLPEDLR